MNVPLDTHYRSFRRRFYGSDDPTNNVIALKDNGSSTTSRANRTRLSSLKGEEKDVSTEIFTTYTAPWRPKTQRRSEDKRAKPSKIKAQYSRLTSKNSELLVPLCTIHNTVPQRIKQAKWGCRALHWLPPPLRILCDRCLSFIRSFCLSYCVQVYCKVISRFHWNLVLWLDLPFGRTD